MNEHVNICGNAPWSITPFSDFGQRPRRRPVDRISSAWVHALDIGLHCTLFTPVVRLTPKNIDFFGGETRPKEWLVGCGSTLQLKHSSVLLKVILGFFIVYC